MIDYRECGTKVSFKVVNFLSQQAAMDHLTSLLTQTRAQSSYSDTGFNIKDGYGYTTTMECGRWTSDKRSGGICLLESLKGKVPEDILQREREKCQARKNNPTS